ncbi:uncharacterized protein [Palaemon carinicauda]|uniref:uncharacterized protein n=1 Tax=Palaemon carinicauda TaxID=392227 RepID=UPI0035B5F0DF
MSARTDPQMHHPNSVDMQGPLHPEGVAEDWSLRAENDIVLLDKHRENLERKLERWRYTLETRELRINRKVAEYMKIKLNGNLQTTIKLGGGNITRAHEFKYIGSPMGKAEDMEKEINILTQCVWNSRRKESGVIR